ncbi:MAG: 23S rRNA (pseudouridine(1915)-N(3))-methyltransferase RlmH [Oceanococcaceae bacterium]
MKLRLLAVATPGPAWADAACEDYLKRFPRHWQTRLQLIPPTKRHGNAAQAHWQQADSDLVRKQLGKDVLILLDERGRQHDSRAFAQRVGQWDEQHAQLSLVIGGPDGHDQALRGAAVETLSLSAMTMPHALARVVLVEQLYRASAILANHPYHRD